LDVKSFSIPSFVTKVEDSIGAGDALLAYSTLSMISTGSLIISSIIGSMAAAIQCEYLGNITVTPEQVLEKINSFEESIKYKKK